jgi:hypothetical protein
MVISREMAADVVEANGLAQVEVEELLLTGDNTPNASMVKWSETRIWQTLLRAQSNAMILS